MQDDYVYMQNNDVDMQVTNLWWHISTPYPTCKINYVYMQNNYVFMQVTNLYREPDFYIGKITYLRCNIIMTTSDLFMLTSDFFM